MQVWSDQTNQFAGQSITPALSSAKDDPTLGVNITDVDPEAMSDVLDAEPVKGAIWTLHDGSPTVDQSNLNEADGESTFSFTFADQTPEHGYSVSVTHVDNDRKITFESKNWYVRYLSLYIRYLDGNDNPLPVSSLPSEVTDAFPFFECCSEWNGEYDIFFDLVSPEWVILGIPMKTTTITKTFPMPAGAVSALVLAGGIGQGSNTYPSSLLPGAVMTGIFDLSLPTLFLALNAAAGVATLNGELQDAATPSFDASPGDTIVC